MLTPFVTIPNPTDLFTGLGTWSNAFWLWTSNIVYLVIGVSIGAILAVLIIHAIHNAFNYLLDKFHHRNEPYS